MSRAAATSGTAHNGSKPAGPAGPQDGIYERSCLSIPDLYLPTTRAEHVVVTGVDLAGQQIKLEATGPLALPAA